MANRDKAEAIQQLIDVVVAALLIQGNLHATGITIDRTGNTISLSGNILQPKVIQIVKLLWP